MLVQFGDGISATREKRHTERQVPGQESAGSVSLNGRGRALGGVELEVGSVIAVDAERLNGGSGVARDELLAVD